jgi:hypothetical protein
MYLIHSNDYNELFYTMIWIDVTVNNQYTVKIQGTRLKQTKWKGYSSGCSQQLATGTTIEPHNLYYNTLILATL